MLKDILKWKDEITEIINSGDYEEAKNEILKQAEELTDYENIYDWILLVTDDLDYLEGEEHTPFEITDITMINFLEDVVSVLIDETEYEDTTIKNNFGWKLTLRGNLYLLTTEILEKLKEYNDQIYFDSEGYYWNMDFKINDVWFSANKSINPTTKTMTLEVYQ